ncbi:MAG: hypothetical protein EXR04_06945 [Rhodospirillales bacterium]|nr:hypothetical protein [Rhodospirillales bacterium]
MDREKRIVVLTGAGVSPAAYFCWLLSMVIVDGQLSSGIHPFTGLPFAAEEQSAEGGGTPGSSD